MDDERAYRDHVAKHAETLGCTPTQLSTLVRGEAAIARFLKTQWPHVVAFGVKNSAEITFTHDILALQSEVVNASFTMQADENNDLLHFDVDVYCAGERVTLESLIEFVKTGSTFLTLPDGRRIEVENKAEIERLVEMVQSFRKRDGGGYEGKLFRAGELQYVATSSKHYTSEQKKSFSTFLKHVHAGKPVKKVALSKKHKELLRPYQQRGIEWLTFLRAGRFGGILADDMGLGKTIQTLIFLERHQVAGRPSIVICPKTLLYNWQREAEKFTPTLRVAVIEGTPSERAALYARAVDYDLIVTSYSAMKQDEPYALAPDMHFNYAVLDEAQSIKNHATKSAMTVKQLNADYRLALTGTPLENNVSEVWSMYDFLMPGLLGNYSQFTRRYHKPIMDGGNVEALEELRASISYFMLRRTKSEVLTELPPKIEQESNCALSDAQNVLYQEILSSVRSDIFNQVELRGFKKAQIHILAGLMKLRQACNHPALVIKKKTWRDYDSAKLDACLEIVETVVREKRKILIFSQFTSMLDIISEALEDRSVPYSLLTGATKNRQEKVDAFNTDPSIPVFLISTKAGGTGLNLTSADTVIIFDPWWNPSVENQAVDRAHRIGQNKSVHVHRLRTKGTIEEKIHALQKKKQGLFDALISESKDTFKKLTWDDVKGLFE
jgi:SNF2 family DNA or RNA helicase